MKRQMHDVSGPLFASVMAGDELEAVRLALEMADRLDLVHETFSVAPREGATVEVCLDELASDPHFMEALDEATAVAEHTGDHEALAMHQAHKAFLRSLRVREL